MVNQDFLRGSFKWVENQKSCELFSNIALHSLNGIKDLFDKLNEIIMYSNKEYRKEFIL